MLAKVRKYKNVPVEKGRKKNASERRLTESLDPHFNGRSVCFARSSKYAALCPVHAAERRERKLSILQAV